MGLVTSLFHVTALSFFLGEVCASVLSSTSGAAAPAATASGSIDFSSGTILDFCFSRVVFSDFTGGCTDAVVASESLESVSAELESVSLPLLLPLESETGDGGFGFDSTFVCFTEAGGFFDCFSVSLSEEKSSNPAIFLGFVFTGFELGSAGVGSGFGGAFFSTSVFPSSSSFDDEESSFEPTVACFLRLDAESTLLPPCSLLLLSSDLLLALLLLALSIAVLRLVLRTCFRYCFFFGGGVLSSSRGDGFGEGGIGTGAFGFCAGSGRFGGGFRSDSSSEEEELLLSSEGCGLGMSTIRFVTNLSAFGVNYRLTSTETTA